MRLTLKDVQLLSGPFKHAMEMDSAYLLSLKARPVVASLSPICWVANKRFGLQRMGK
jgi:hypothetical protein